MPKTSTAAFDHPWKDALDAFFPHFLELLFPYIYKEIDWSRGFEFLDKELLQIAPDGEQGQGVVDKLIKVWLKDGQENWLLLHIEVQSQPEAQFPRRIYVYNYRIFDKYNREVVSLVVLGDDRAHWRPDKYVFEKWGFRQETRFPVVKLLDLQARTAEMEASSNPMAAVVLAHLSALETRNDPGRRRFRKFQLVRNLYERGFAVEQIRQLFRLVDWLMQLPQDLEIQFKQDFFSWEGENHMPYVTSIERLAIEEGKQLGIEEGLQKGLQQGVQKGTRKGLLAGIKLGLELKFGSRDASFWDEVKKITDVDKLEKILVAIKKANSLDALRKIAGRK